MNLKTVIIVLKPDIIKRRLEDSLKEIISLEIWRVIDEKRLIFSKENLEVFYEEHKNKEFFSNIIRTQANKENLILLVETRYSFWILTNLKKEIRDLFSLNISENSIHITDSKESAIREKELYSNY